MEISVKRLSESAILPTKAYEHDAGYDLYSTDDVTIKAGGTTLVSTGISMEIPQGYVGLIWPRSGLAVKKGIDVFAGVIDSGYRNEIKVCLFNSQLDALVQSSDDGWGATHIVSAAVLCDNQITIKKGDKIAQILIQPAPHFDLLEVKSLSESDRGGKGFGSSG